VIVRTVLKFAAVFIIRVRKGLDKPNLITSEPKIAVYCLAGQNESFQVFPKSHKDIYGL